MKNGLHIDEHGTKKYYLNNELHRVDGPAIEYTNGNKFWWLNGEKHRVDGHAEERKNGNKVWWVHGKLHRVGGPAEEYPDGSTVWWLNGELHREDGPAIEFANGDKHWYLHGNELKHPTEFDTMEEFIQKLNNNEVYSLQWINDFNGMIGMIKEPSGKQKRLHAMRWKI